MTELHPSALELDALAIGALDGAEARRVGDHLAACERCRGAADASRADREAFRSVVLPRTAAAVVERARPLRGRRAPWTWWLIPAVAAAAALLWLIRPATEPEIPSEGGAREAVLAVKGAAALQLFASRDGKVFAVRDGAALRPGDRIRFVVQPAGLPHVMVASIYFPTVGSRSGAVDPAARTELPGSIELDDAAGPERVYALFTREPLEADQVIAALRAVGAAGPAAIRDRSGLAVAADAQASLVFEKAAP
jgi:hypothetical protein